MNLFRKEITVEESRLESASQQKIASLVKAMPDEDLSLSWRSELNVKLMAAQEAKYKKRATRRVFTWGTSLSCGVAASVVAITMFNPTAAPNAFSTRAESKSLASEMVTAHQESLVLASVSAIPTSNHETPITEEIYNPQDDLL